MTSAPNNSQDDSRQIPLAPVTAREVNAQRVSEEEEGINFSDFFRKCIYYWRWFAASVILFIGLGVLYIVCTPKSYTVSASVVIKDDESGQSSSISSTLSDLGLFQTSSNVANELLAFQSPALIGDVISRLGLQTNYTYVKMLRRRTLYGDSAVIIARFPDIKPQDGISFKVDLKGNGKAELFDLRKGKLRSGETYDITLGDTVSTVYGKVVITPGPDYSPDFDYTIRVVHTPMAEAIEDYQKKFKVTLADDDATVIDFAMTDVNRKRETNFLNTLIQIYNEKWRDDKEQMAIATSNFINDRLGVIEKELGSVDSDIANYKGENLLPDIEAATTMFMADANENTKRQLDVNTQISIIQYIIDYIQESDGYQRLLPANTGIESPGITAQITEYNTRLLERENLLTATGANSPMVQTIDTNLASMRSALLASLKNQKQGLQTELNSLIRSDRSTIQKIAASPSQAKYLLSVERQQKVKEALYLFLLQKREENELSLAFTPSNTRVITPPWGSALPTAPKTHNILLLALVAGILIPAVVIFISASLNTRVNSRADLDNLRAPFVGEIPEAERHHRGLRRWRRRWRDIRGKESKMEEAPSLLVHAHGRSVVNEAFRMVRSNLEFITRNGKNRVVMVTSFNPGSGKSFISLNLAAAMAVKRTDSKILVIDLDLRRASLSRVLDQRFRGISDYLSEAVDDYASLIQESACKGLYILPVGTIPPNPAELLYSPRLQQLLDKLRQEYDYIFLDCPPAEIVADTTIITPLADATVFVLRAGLMDRRLLPDLNYIYDTHRFNNLLVLLNGTTSAGAPYRRYVYSNYYSSNKD